MVGSGQNIEDLERYQRRQGGQGMEEGGQGVEEGKTKLNPKDEDGRDSSNSTIHWSKQIVQWGHWAPSCPDTMSIFPFSSRDPFIMVKEKKIGDACIPVLPDILVTGNQAKYESARVRLAGESMQQCLLVHVPSFSKNPSLVLVDIINRKSKIVNFKVELDLAE